MKQIIQKLIILVITLLSSLSISAFDFEVDGLCFNIISIADMTCELSSISSIKSNVTVPAQITYNGRELKNIRIGYRVFKDCTGLETINIEEGVESIAEYAFAGCSSLRKFVVPASIVEIKDHSFDGCTSLENVRFMDSDIEIKIGEAGSNNNQGLFIDCPLREVYLGRDCSYKTSPFPYNNKYERFVFGGNVKNVELNMFQYLYINEIEFQNGPEICSIWGYFDTSEHGMIYSFKNVGGLRNVILNRQYKVLDEKGVEAWSGSGVFGVCESITNAIIGNDMVDLPFGTFAFCDSLKKVRIGDNLEIIGNDAFVSSGLEEVIVNEKLTTIGANAFSNTNISSFKFPDGLTTIGRYAFEGCLSLDSIYTNNIEKINDYAFRNCPKISNLHIGDKLNYLGRNVFPQSSLQKIVIDNPIPPTVESDDCFNIQVYLNADLYVPNSAKDKYYSAPVWKNFWNIKGMDDSAIADITVDKNEGMLVIYNLQGNLVMKTQKYEDLQKLPVGIYIVNGKKYIIR